MDRYPQGGVGSLGAQSAAAMKAPETLAEHIEHAIAVLNQFNNLCARHEQLNFSIGMPSPPNPPGRTDTPAPDSLIPRLGRVVEDIQHTVARYDIHLSRTESLLGAKL